MQKKCLTTPPILKTTAIFGSGDVLLVLKVGLDIGYLMLGICNIRIAMFLERKKMWDTFRRHLGFYDIGNLTMFWIQDPNVTNQSATFKLISI